MLSEATIEKVTSYWASDLGCPSESLFAQPFNVIEHGGGLVGYEGVFAIFHDGAATVCFPAQQMGPLRQLLSAERLTPQSFSDVFRTAGFTVIGPAVIGYAEAMPEPIKAARDLTESDAATVERLRQACCQTEWEHGGSEVGSQLCSGVFDGSELAALASYEIWGGIIAHISIITHPAFRGRGLGRLAVAHRATAAIRSGLIPQYRTLEANLASVRVAESLGFVPYARTVAVKLKRGG